MRWLRGALWMGLACVLGGCGGGFSKTAREKCREAGASDAFFDVWFNQFETDRQAGDTESQVVSTVVFACERGDCFSDGIDTLCGNDCVTCMTAIADEVYAN